MAKSSKTWISWDLTGGISKTPMLYPVESWHQILPDAPCLDTLKKPCFEHEKNDETCVENYVIYHAESYWLGVVNWTCWGAKLAAWDGFTEKTPFWKSSYCSAITCIFFIAAGNLLSPRVPRYNICHLDVSHVFFFCVSRTSTKWLALDLLLFTQVGCCSTVVVVCWRSELTKLEICRSLPSSFLMPGALYLLFSF